MQDEAHRQGIERSKFLYDTIAKRLEELNSVRDYGGYDTQVLATPRRGEPLRKKYALVLSFGLLIPLKETQMVGRHRPAQLFRFDADKYDKLKQRGFNFEL